MMGHAFRRCSYKFAKSSKSESAKKICTFLDYFFIDLEARASAYILAVTADRYRVKKQFLSYINDT